MSRPHGSKNKITRDMKEIIFQAFEKAGGVDYLVTVARRNPAAFLTLLGRIVPAEIKAELTSPELVALILAGRRRVLEAKATKQLNGGEVKDFHDN